MGVSGCGKSTIGKLLAEMRQSVFLDGDDYHPERNIVKMQSGQPLNDADRAPWLISIREAMDKHEGDELFVGCSALKEAYRAELNKAKRPVQWILLQTEPRILAERLSARSEHFFPEELLDSQLETLEIPSNAWHIDISGAPGEIADRIIKRIEMEETRSQIGLIGLGVMGQNLALNIAENEWRIAVFNREVPGVEEEVARGFVAAHPEFRNITPCNSLGDFIMQLERPRKIILMVTAGKAVGSVLDEIIGLLEPGDIVIDAGNSYYRHTRRRFRLLKKAGIEFIGLGVSGGHDGARHGPSLMVGGSKKAYKEVQPILTSIAALDPQGIPCSARIGNDGAGHFIKMVHNGIEYAEMELLAECYRMLNLFNKMGNEDIANVFESWRGVNDSFLIQITIDILRTHDGEDYMLNRIKDTASHKGTGRWTVQEAMRLGVPSHTIAAALFARQTSARKGLRVYLGEMLDSEHDYGKPLEVDALMNAYILTRIINHAIGFDILRAASEEYSWDLKYKEVARVWTAGCIIRSGLMYELSKVLPDDLTHMFSLKQFSDRIIVDMPFLQEVVARAAMAGVGVPVLSGGHGYIANLISPSLPTNLIQAQRDYFGAHGFHLVGEGEDEALHHFNWSGYYD